MFLRETERERERERERTLAGEGQRGGERQTKKQTLNYREQTDGYQRGDSRGMGKIGDGD